MKFNDIVPTSEEKKKLNLSGFDFTNKKNEKLMSTKGVSDKEKYASSDDFETLKSKKSEVFEK